MISVLLAAYNGEKYLADQIESLLAQTIRSFVLYIQDDCSTDATYSIGAAYMKKYPETIIVSRNENRSGGAKHNFMRMMISHKDDYVVLCDQDDVWMPDKLEKTLMRMKALEKEHGLHTPALVHTDLTVTDDGLRVISPSMREAMELDFSRTELRQQLVQSVMTGCTAMYNRALAELIDREPAYMIMHDWWLMLIAAAFGRIGVVEQPTMLYRQHGKNEIGAKNVKAFRYKLHKALDGKQVRAALDKTYQQAQSFLAIYGSRVSPRQRDLLAQYCQIPSLSKIERLKVVTRLGIYKSGRSRNLGYLIYL